MLAEDFPPELKKFINTVSEVVSKVQQQKSHHTLSNSQLSMCFDIFASLFFASNKNITISFVYENALYELYLQYTKSALQIEKQLDYDLKITLDLKILEPYLEEGWIFLFLAFLQGHGTHFSSDLPPLLKYLSQIKISISGFKTLLQWFFPYSGIAIVVQDNDKCLPIVLYGGKTLHGKVFPVREQKKILEATKQFRYENNIAFAVGVELSFLLETISKTKSLKEFFKNYQKKWAISLPTEIDDFLINYQSFFALIIPKNIAHKLTESKNNAILLLKNYYQSLQEYWKKNFIYIRFFGEEKEFCFAINGLQIEEVKSPQDYLFQFNIDSFNTWSSWLNDKSIRLFIRFLDAITPISWIKRITTDEILLKLKLKNSKNNELDLFIIGKDISFHNKLCSGEFYFVLLYKDKVIFQQQISDSKPTIIHKNDLCEIHFPLHSSLSGISFVFNKDQCGQVNRGFSHLISETSIIAEIAPGLRNKIYYGLSKDIDKNITIEEKNYTVIGGSAMINTGNGRKIKYDPPLQTSQLSILQKQGSYFVAHGTMPNAQDNWQKFATLTETIAANVQQTCITKFKYNEINFPKCNKEKNAVLVFEELPIVNSEIPTFFKYKVLQAWIVPDYNSFHIRIVCVCEQRKQERGIAIFEYPCEIPESLQPNRISILKSMQNQKRIEFLIGKTCIFYIQHPSFSLFAKKRIASIILE